MLQSLLHLCSHDHVIFTTLIKDDILYTLKTEESGVYEYRCTSQIFSTLHLGNLSCYSLALSQYLLIQHARLEGSLTVLSLVLRKLASFSTLGWEGHLFRAFCSARDCRSLIPWPNEHLLWNKTHFSRANTQQNKFTEVLEEGMETDDRTGKTYGCVTQVYLFLTFYCKSQLDSFYCLLHCSQSKCLRLCGQYRTHVRIGC